MKFTNILRWTATSAAALCSICALAASDTIAVEQARVYGPFQINAPYLSAAKNAAGSEYSVRNLLDNSLPTDRGETVQLNTWTVDSAAEPQIGSITFRITASGFAKVTVPVTGVTHSKTLIDGRAADGETKLKAGSHTVQVRWLAEGSAEPRVSVITTRPDLIKVGTDDGKRTPRMTDFTDGRRLRSATVSPDGSMLIALSYNARPGGSNEWQAVVSDIKTGRQLATVPVWMHWMPQSPLLYNIRQVGNDRQLYTLDPRTGTETVIARNLPASDIKVSPTEDRLLLTTVTEGPREGDVYQIIEPEDRQPGWRNRTSLSVYDIASGVTRPLTFGSVSTWLTDISRDGSKALVMSKRNRLEKRPTTLYTVMTIDLATAKADTIVAADGFINSASFSPDASQVLVTGSPEAFDGIGRNLPEGRTPSMYDYQLYTVSCADRSVTPLTRDFNPSVANSIWNADGLIYFRAEDGDCERLYVLDPATLRTRVAVTGEEMVTDFSVSDSGNIIAWVGNGASNSDRMYVTDTKRNKTSLIIDGKGEALADVQLPVCKPWNFVNSKGDTIIGRYYLPVDFDPTRKYPVIVNYYGGCTPTGRLFEGRYPHNLYATNGYVVYVLNPSGSAGRGQEFASRHVNTAGEGVADDIIEGTLAFVRQHQWTDSTKIGCIGASYGGFMTQYLQTVTDIFAAAISHAGISGHTSYWGEGYWGYSYSEVSMANTYPWSDRDLYVGHSPIYNVDKIHTPILFLHGDKDNNVPFGESIQMFTALKLLGRETALVAVTDQDHHILDYNKFIRWQDTIFAWFDKYLKGDSDWWNDLYPEKEL